MNYDQKMFQFQQVPNNGAYINAQPVNIQYRIDPQQQIFQQQQPQHIQHQIIQQQPQQHIQIQQQPPPPQPQPVREGGKCPVRGKTSPYGFFVKMCYEEHKKKYPGENVQVTEISKKCAEKWKTMNEDEKRRFNELAAKDAERYSAEIQAYGGEDALKKKKRAKKDPNAPKRALSAFFFFSNEKRPEVQAAHSEWKVGQVAQELGRMWKALTEEEKAVYDNKANMDKQRYADEMKNYKVGQPISSSQESGHHQSQQMQQQQQPVKQEIVHGTIVTTSQPHQMQQPQLQHQQPQMVVIQQQPGQQGQMQPMHVQMIAQPGEM